MTRPFPNNIVFQWHITNECNYRCKHCYQDDYSKNSPSLEQLKKYLGYAVSFVEKCKEQNEYCRAHINITGGEPFLYPQLLELLTLIQNTALFSIGILSNGFLLPVQSLEKLKELNIRFVQISLEGSKKTNDYIRGKGSYNTVVNAIKAYRKVNIPSIISFTANAKNYKEFSRVVRTARKYKARKVWTDRYLPHSIDDELALTELQAYEYFRLIKKEQDKNKRRFFSKTIVSSQRALQFLTCGGKPYTCSAGKTLLTIMPNGDIMPCRRLPIVVGNLQSSDFITIYKKSDVLRNIDYQLQNNEECKSCFYSDSCNGGLKCLSYIYDKELRSKDIHCWI